VILARAWRSWQRARGVAVLAAVALAIGIGSATAIYSVVNAVMLKPLPLPEGERFIALFEGNLLDPRGIGTLQRQDIEIFHQRSHSFDLFGWYRGSGQNLVFGGEAHHVSGIRLTLPLAQNLGVDPQIGRWFTDETGVMISHELWRRLGSDAAIVGKPLTLDAQSYAVAGVMPPAFRFPVKDVGAAGARPDVWLPLDIRERAAYFVYARRKPGVTFAAAQADLRRVAAEIAAEAPATHRSFTAAVWDLRQTVTEEIRPTLFLLFGAAGMLFLITCANAAGLLLTRAVARARETATRVALGAGRWQLAAQFFLEGLLVAGAGATGGVLLAMTLTPAIVAMTADYLPRADQVSVDWTVLLFAVGAAVAASALSSLAPLWQAMRAAPADALGEGVRASASAKSRRVSRWLIVAEMAFAFGLLTLSAMLLLNLRQLTRTATGFDPDGVVTFVVSVPGTIAQRDDRRRPYQQRLLDAIRAVPGIDDVAFASSIPLDGCCASVTIHPEGRALEANRSARMSVVAASPGYFETMRIPLRSGRLLTERDVSRDTMLAVISLATARQYWDSDDPVGAFGRFNRPDGQRFEVVGVVGDVQNDGLGKPSVPEIYISSAIQTIETTHFVVRSTRPAALLAPEIRAAVRRVDPEQPVHGIRAINDVIASSMTLERVASSMTAFFAAAALVLATLGVYGVVAYSVRQRTVEIGTRMALGASSQHVLSLVVRDGLVLAAIAVAAGGAVTLAAAGALRSFLEIGTPGPAPYLYATIIVGALVLAATALPASRAAMLSPMVAIRNDQSPVWQAARVQVRRILEPTSDAVAAPLAGVVGDFADAVRQADSFPEAVQVAVGAVRQRAGADFIALLLKHADTYASGELAIPGDGLLVNRLRHYGHPLAFSEADWSALARWAQQFRPARLEEIERLAHARIGLAVPLRIKNDIVGVLLLGRPRDREGFSQADKRILDSAADVLALMIENARLNERALEQETLRRDLALAVEVQKRLLPRQPPPCAFGTLAAYTLPARSIGGDYYDFVELPGGELGIAIADVSGKGIAAALLMSVVQASLRLISADPDRSCAQLASRMNRFLYGSTAGNKYATFFYAQIDMANLRLHFVNAGHNPPYLVRRTLHGAEAQQLSAGGTVLGLFPDSDYAAGEVAIRPGDVLVAFTDGVSEALNPAGEEFGEERLEALLVEAIGSTADDIAARLTAAMREWIADAEPHDDLTFVVLALNE
jgi:putative ABC transport system permease protein